MSTSANFSCGAKTGTILCIWLTVGSIMMAGTSPAPYGRSPSLHSSSYLPKAEANFLKDYKCCGLTLDSLHELLQHFEENHAQPSHQIAHRASVSSQTGASGGRRPSTGMGAVETTRGFSGFDQQRTQQPVRPVNPQTSNQQGKDGFNRTQLSTVQDVDTMDDLEMDMDESTDLFAPQQHHTQTSQSNSGFNMNPTSSGNVPAQQAFRTSAPTTPSTGQPFAQFGNPTVSSVNTPALNTNDMQQAQGLMSPNQSIPGTPGELDPNFAADFLGGGSNFDALPTDYSLMDFGQPGMDFGLENNLGHMTIDDPAKRLYSKQGGMNNNQFQFGNKSGPMSMDGEMAKRLREQQLIGNLGGPIPGFPEPEQKPFKCPVIGCEKSYKNQNGLKYHKQVKFFFCTAYVLNLTLSSTVIKTNSSRKMQTVLIPLLTQRHQYRTPEPLAWKRRSHTDVRCVANVIRISMALNTTDNTHRSVIPKTWHRNSTRLLD